MKIALISPYNYFHPGGVNTHIANLAMVLRASGQETYVLTTLPPGRPTPPDTIALDGHLTQFPSGGVQAHINLSLNLIWRARQLLLGHNFDIVHLHNPLTPLVSVSFLYHRRAVPQTTFIATFHEYRDTPNPAIEVGKPLFRHWINTLDARIAVSEAALEFNQLHFPGTYAIIPNGVDLARFAPARQIEMASKRPPTILFVGRLDERKGLLYLLDAFVRLRPEFPTARLQVVGPGHLSRREVRQQPLTNVEFIGQVSDAELPAFYHGADIFCAPSVGFESFGIVLLEAMAAGLPVVASNLPGYRQTIQDGKQGWLVEPRNPGALAAALAQLLRHPERRREMGEAGQAHARLFDWHLVAEAVLELYIRTRIRQKNSECW